MENKLLEAKAAIQILTSAQTIFEAIVDPVKMSYYFIAKSSGVMEEGKNLQWQFPEFEQEIPVRVGKIEKDKYVSFYWGENGKELLVEITLAGTDLNKTLVTVTEKGMENNEEGIAWLKRNTEGWANFLACLKAFLEYGINLRKGAFDFMSEGSDREIKIRSKQ